MRNSYVQARMRVCGSIKGRGQELDCAIGIIELKKKHRLLEERKDGM